MDRRALLQMGGAWRGDTPPATSSADVTAALSARSSSTAFDEA